MSHASAAGGLAQVQFSGGELPAWLDHWRLIKAWWRVAALVTLTAMAATAVTTRFWMTKWYRADALIAPSEQESGLGMLANGALAGQLGGMLNGRSTRLAEQYVATLRSFAFTISLLEKDQLGTRILSEPRDIKALDRIDRWELYRTMKRRFSCEYDVETDNIALHFADPDPATAQMVLNFYIDGLRARMSRQAAQQAHVAAATLEKEIETTSDEMLRARLYDLAAQQIEREKEARVSADAAFVEIEPPVVPAWPFRPRVVLDTLLAGLVTLFLLTLVLLLVPPVERLWKFLHFLEEQERGTKGQRKTGVLDQR